MDKDGMKEIAEAIKAGSREVFETFYRVEYLNLEHFVKGFVGNDPYCEDIIQDSFMALWDSRNKIYPEGNLRTFLYTIARNKSVSHLRKKALNKKNTIDGEEALVKIMLLCHQNVSDEINALDLENTIARIYAAIPEKIKRTFIMSRVDGMTYKQIAEKLGVSVKLVEYHISIALNYFRKQLLDYSVGVKVIALLISVFSSTMILL
jgi:RNA polymerase sigma-70 factor (ECF subfamily)